MKRNRSKQHYIKVTGIKEYIEGNKWLGNIPFVITPFENFYLYNGQRVNAKEFEQAFPPVELVKNRIDKGEGKDGRTNWM